MQRPNDRQPRQHGSSSRLNAEASDFAPGSGDVAQADVQQSQGHGARASYQQPYPAAQHMNPYNVPYGDITGQSYGMDSNYQSGYMQSSMSGTPYGGTFGGGLGMGNTGPMAHGHQAYGNQGYGSQAYNSQVYGYGASSTLPMGPQGRWSSQPAMYQPPLHESVSLMGRRASPMLQQPAGRRTPLAAQQANYPRARTPYLGQDPAVPGLQPVSRGPTPVLRGPVSEPSRQQSRSGGSQSRQGNQSGSAPRGRAVRRGPSRDPAAGSARLGEHNFPSLGSQSAAQGRSRPSSHAAQDADAQLVSQLSSTGLSDHPHSSRSRRRPNYVPFAQHPDASSTSTGPPPTAPTSQPPARRGRNRDFRLSISEIYRGKIVYIDKSPSVDYGEHPAVVSAVNTATRQIRFWKMSSFRECRGFANKYAGYRNPAARKSHEKGWVLIWDGGATGPHHDTPMLRLGAGKVLGGPTYVDVVAEKELHIDGLSKLSKERRFPELWLEEEEMMVMEEYSEEYNRTKPDFSSRRRQLDGADDEDFDQELGFEELEDGTHDADDEADEEE